MGNKKWNKEWKEYVQGLSGLRWITNDKDSERVRKIMLKICQLSNGFKIKKTLIGLVRSKKN